jgi:outer membrane protein TolC
MRIFQTITLLSVFLSSGLYASKGGDDFAMAKLSLESCLERLLDSNLEIKAGVISSQLRENDVLIAGEKFQSGMSIKADHSNIKRPSDFIFETINDIQDENSNLNVGLKKLWEVGTLTSLEWNHSRSKTNTALNKINPGYSDDLKLKVSQPLFQGLGKRIQTIDIQKSKYFFKLSQIQQRMTEEAKLLKVSQMYWMLSLARENLKPLKSELKLSKNRTKLYEALLAQGKITQLDLEESKKNQKLAQTNLIEAENEVQFINQQLVAEIFPAIASDVKKFWVLPTTKFSSNLVDKISTLGDLKIKAYYNRLELKKEAIQLAIAELDILKAENKKKSNTSLFGALGVKGLSDKPSKAIQRTHTGKYPNWELGIQLSFYIDPISRNAQWENAILQKENIELIQETIKTKISIELVKSLSQLKNAKFKSEDISIELDLAHKKLKKIDDEVKLGKSTTLRQLEKQVQIEWLKFQKSQLLVQQWMSGAQLLSAQGLLFKELISKK